MQQTTVFKLKSGPECEIKKMDASHQKILTRNNKTTFTQKLYAVLKDLIVRVGTEVYFDKMSDKQKDEFLSTMLVCDKKQVLVEARNFTNEDDLDFIFTYKYINKEGKETSIEKILPITKDSFVGKPVFEFHESLLKDLKTNTAWRAFMQSDVFQPLDAVEYSQVLSNVTMEYVLPQCSKRVSLTMRDGKSDDIVDKIPEEERSSHTAILSARPKWYDEASGSWISFQDRDLDKLSILDVETMRYVLLAFEGTIDTEVMFDHPEAQYKVGKERVVIINLLNEITFFFLSGAI